jgi:hypothetical protein
MKKYKRVKEKKVEAEVLSTPRAKSDNKQRKRVVIEHRLKPEALEEMKARRRLAKFWKEFYANYTDWRVYSRHLTERQRDESLKVLIKKSRSKIAWHRDFEYRAGK